jgi:AAA+ superfamily predicted ATPase
MEVAVSSIEVTTSKQVDGQVPPLGALCPALRRLDLLLDAATRGVQPSRAADGSPMFRGLFLTPEQVGRLLSQTPGGGEFRTAEGILSDNLLGVSPNESPLAWIAHAFGLSNFDVDLMLIALAPEIDLRYEKIYGYLQDDITRKRPTVELALNLLCASPDEKLQRRSHFAGSAPLVKNGLLQLVVDGNQPEPASLSRYLRLDDGVTRFLLGQSGLDPRIAGFSELIESSQPWDKLPIDAGILRALPQLIAEAAEGGNLRCFYFQGATRTDRCEAAGALAKAVGLRLLSVRVDRMPDGARPEPPWKLLFREARISGSVLYISDLEDFRGVDAKMARHALLEELRNQPGVTILAGTSAWIPNSSCEILPVVFATPDFAQRRVCWEQALHDLSLQAEPADLDKMAARFMLSASQIVQASSSASINTRWRAAQSCTTSESTPACSLHFAELSAAARNQCGHELSTLARKIEPRYCWEDIILPPDPKQQLREICQQAEYRDVVFGQWGFDRKLSLGKGLNVLFGGPPGTGKTMAAEVIAHELALDLYRIDLSQVVSKYIGETEKNLDRIFTAAEQSNAILFFDEADALFGKRSEVRDSHDRYANIEISYLLQKMEEYQGISVLATNLRQNLDEAFVRRLQAIVEFPFPDEHHRRRIWENVFPTETPLGDDVKFDVLAREVRLAGGNIKNMALAAAFAAAAENSMIHLSHLIQAAHREHQKLSRSWDPGALSKVLAAHA